MRVVHIPFPSAYGQARVSCAPFVFYVHDCFVLVSVSSLLHTGRQRVPSAYRCGELSSRVRFPRFANSRAFRAKALQQ